MPKYYIGDFVRIGNNRWRVYHESGHADIVTASAGNSTEYRYYVRDYLGSTRAVLAEDGTLLQDANYYPGGLSFSQLNDSEETDRLHSGKEWVDLEGLAWYDNAARFHDPILCRFTTPDPLAEKYPALSPYSHCANNPMTIVDPSGKVIDFIWDAANVLYDVSMATYNHVIGDHDTAMSHWVDATVDAASFFIPLVPAGATKVAKQRML